MVQHYLEELCDAFCEVFVTLDVELQLVKAGGQGGRTAALVTPEHIDHKLQKLFVINT